MQGDNREEFPRRASRKGLGKRVYHAVFRTGALILGCSVLFASGFLLGLYRAAAVRPAAGQGTSSSITATYDVPTLSNSPVQSMTASGSASEPATGDPAAGPDEAAPSVEELLATMRWPADGRIVREPGWMLISGTQEWTYFPGVDIQVESGSPVRAVLDGKVKGVTDDPVFGKTVLVTHDGGLESTYGRLSAPAVSQGSRVSRGDVLGTSGKEPVYFKISRDGEALNPVDYLTSTQ